MMTAIVRRLTVFRTRHRVLAGDALPVLALAAAALPHPSDGSGPGAGAAAGVTGAHHPVTALLWLPALLGPLLWRRRAPITVLACLLAVATVIGLPALLGPAPDRLTPVAGAALLLALATVAADRPRVNALISAATLGTWGLLVLPYWAPGEGRLSTSGAGLWCCAVAAATLAGMYLQTKRDYAAALRERAARLEHERDQQARIAVGEERTRIARELHDVVSHNLAVVIALADGAAETAPDPGAGLMRQVAATGRQAIDEMGLILGLLRHRDRDQDPVDWAPQPGIAQLDELVEATSRTGLPARLAVAGTPRDLGPGLQLTVYRIVQEALTNVRKHARGATSAQVRLTYHDTRVEIEITDDGRGVPPIETGGTGHGLTGMRERAAAFAGSLDAGPASEGGWRIRALLTASKGAR